MLTLAPMVAGLCVPGTTALQRSPRPLCARLRPVLPAPRMAAPDEEEAAPRTGKSEVFGEMSAEVQAAFPAGLPLLMLPLSRPLAHLSTSLPAAAFLQQLDLTPKPKPKPTPHLHPAQAAFLQQLDEECAAAGVTQSSRFRGLLDAMGEGGDAEWRVLAFNGGGRL
eukprot:scaffold26643_cov66-Phaeocystis_antarctica.AAC.1